MPTGQYQLISWHIQMRHLMISVSKIHRRLEYVSNVLCSSYLRISWNKRWNSLCRSLIASTQLTFLLLWSDFWHLICAIYMLYILSNSILTLSFTFLSYAIEIILTLMGLCGSHYERFIGFRNVIRRNNAVRSCADFQIATCHYPF